MVEQSGGNLTGKFITAGNEPGQLPTRFFNAIMRNAHSTTGLAVDPSVAEGQDKINAEVLGSTPPEELQLLVRQLGPKGVEYVRKVLSELQKK